MSHLNKIIQRASRQNEHAKQVQKKLDEVLIILAILTQRNGGVVEIPQEDLANFPDLVFNVSIEDGIIKLQLTEPKEENPVEP
jgi:hypothetical protein